MRPGLLALDEYYKNKQDQGLLSQPVDLKAFTAPEFWTRDVPRNAADLGSNMVNYGLAAANTIASPSDYLYAAEATAPDRSMFPPGYDLGLEQSTRDRLGYTPPEPLPEDRSQYPLTTEWWGAKQAETPLGQAMGVDPNSAGYQAGLLGPWPDFGDVARVGPAFIASTGRQAAASPGPLADIGRAVFNGSDASAPGERSLARRVRTTGHFRGAPTAVTTPGKLRSLRTKLKDLLERGVPGRLWYDNSSSSASYLTGNRPGYKDLYAGNVAVTSADTAVPSNSLFAIKGYNQAIAGDPIHTGRYPKAMSELIDDVVGGRPVTLGPKRDPFLEALMVEPGQKIGRPTNDLWMARAFGYERPNAVTGEMEEWVSGLGTAQHRFMDEEVESLVAWANKNKVGGFDDWTPERVQASVWVSTKADREGTTIERAARDFSDGLDDLTMRVNVESEPSVSSGHLPGVIGDEQLTGLLSDAYNTALTNEHGQSRAGLQSGALTRGGTRGPGTYNDRSVPVESIGLLGAPSTGSRVIEPSSGRVQQAVAATEGILRTQDSVGATFLRPAANATERNAAELVLDRVLTRDEMLKLNENLTARYGANTVIATSNPRGANILVIDDVGDWLKPGKDPGTTTNGKGQDDLTKLIKEQFGVKPDWKVNSAPEGTYGLIGGDEFKPSDYLREFDESGMGEQMDPLLRSAAPQLEAIDAAFVKDFPQAGKRAEMVSLTRQILGDEGIEGIRRAVEAGILPVVVLGIVLHQFGGEQQQQPQGFLSAPSGI